jgi:hypothetical protein
MVQLPTSSLASIGHSCTAEYQSTHGGWSIGAAINVASDGTPGWLRFGSRPSFIVE